MTSFSSIAARYMSRKRVAQGSTAFDRQFRSHFGMSVVSCEDVWQELAAANLHISLKKVHLLWALFHLKVYASIDVSSCRFGTTPPTWRKWVEIVLDRLLQLDVIHWDSRFENWNSLQPSCYVDGVHCYAEERRPIRRSDYSHKLNRAGWAFEIATALGVSKIVHVSGGVPAGDWPDLKLARSMLVPRLLPGERVAADKGYREQGGNGSFVTPVTNRANDPVIDTHNIVLKKMGARHETVNKRMKDYQILKSYCGKREEFPKVFFVVANLTQIKLRTEPLYSL
ncbi:hypothetical protein BDR26DRAFT_1016149 [Obelidium mucronatum]|nr:hypothetical protein BDR26DRAFT_1016149 [Obelidium mucronatum]